MLDKALLFLFGLLLSISIMSTTNILAAEENTAQTAAPRADATNSSDGADEELAKKEEEIQIQTEPSATTKKRRFDSFVPSEQISADNAVPFPVDI